MAKTKKKVTKEEILAKDRLRKKQEYIKIKSDPELYRLQKEKERRRYILKKLKNKIQSIEDMSIRAQREQRRRWRTNSRKYSNKKKEQRKIQQILLENSPPTTPPATDNEDNNPVAPALVPDMDPLARNPACRIEEEMRGIRKESTSVRKVRYNAMKLIKNLKDEVRKLQKEKDILRKRTQKLELQQKNVTKTIEDSVEKKVNELIKDLPDEKIQEVKKKLLFDETVTRKIKKKYEALKKTDKRSFVEDLLASDNARLKKYKVKGKLPFAIRKRLSDTRKNKTHEIKQKITGFFEDDIISSVAPGKKEFIKRRGIKKQKRYLTENLKNLHNKYCKEYGKVSYATFCKYRPFWTVFPDGKRETCLCKLHCNANLLLQSLKTAKVTTQGTVAEMLDDLCCDSSNEACLKRSCNTCKHKSLNYAEFDNNKDIKFKEWIVEKKNYQTKNGKQQVAIITTKKTFEDKPRNLILKLESTMDALFKHTQNIVVQTSAIKTLKQNLTDTEVLIHVDFSENYSLKFHEEVQSFHFGGSRGQISLHTVVLYYVDTVTGLVMPKSMCTISQCLNHDASAIWAHIIPVLNVAKELVPLLAKIHFLSDSPSSQYRNRYIFYMITRLQQVIPTLNLVTWNYQEAGHGKGAPDGIGAVIKRTADSHVKFGGDVGTFEDFEKILRKEIANIELLVIPEDEVNRKKFPAKVPGFKGTTKVHQVIWSSSLPHSVALRGLSCFSCQYSHLPCEHGKHLGVLEVEEVTTCPSDVQDALDFDSNLENRSTLEIDTPTIFNNIDDNMILNEFDGTMFLDETPSQLVSVDKEKSNVTILSNVPFDYSLYKSRLSATQRFDVQQQEFQKFIAFADSTNIDDKKIHQPSTSKGIEKDMDHNCDTQKCKNATSMKVEENEENIALKYNVDDWVIVKYTVKDKPHYFIGKIVSKDEMSCEYNLNFLKKAQGKILKFGWPNISDDDVVTESQIVQTVSEPEKDRRGQFLFKKLPKLYFK